MPIDLLAASQVAGIVGGAITSFDRIYRGWFEFVKNKNKSNLPQIPPDFQIKDKPDEQAIVTTSAKSGETLTRVTYEELRSKVSESDWDYVSAMTETLDKLSKQWLSVYRQKVNETGRQRAILESQLDDIAKDMADPLIRVINFCETIGLQLDDHYLIARDLAKGFIGKP